MKNQPETLTKEDREFFKAQSLVLNREVKDLMSERAWDEIEDRFFHYGKFLERNPKALSFQL